MSQSDLFLILIIFIFIISFFFVQNILHGIKNKKIATNAEKNYTSQTQGIVSKKYFKEIRRREGSKQAETQTYVKIKYTVGIENYQLETFAWNFHEGDIVTVFYDSTDPNKAIIERDFKDKKEDGVLKRIFGQIKVLVIFILLILLFIFIVDREFFFELIRKISEIIQERGF